jgi:hypothetical protein
VQIAAGQPELHRSELDRRDMATPTHHSLNRVDFLLMIRSGWRQEDRARAVRRLMERAICTVPARKRLANRWGPDEVGPSEWA